MVRGRYGEFKVLVDGEPVVDGGSLAALGVLPPESGGGGARPTVTIMGSRTANRLTQLVRRGWLRLSLPRTLRRGQCSDLAMIQQHAD
jgi:hypothetical protein